MCLHKAKKIEQEGEITCYKVLLGFSYDNNGVYRSPFCVGTSWMEGETKVAMFRGMFPNPNVVNKYGEIESGAFHTLKTWDDAVEYSGWFSGNKFIAECVIPKDNEYLYEGNVKVDSDDFMDGYASKKLKVVKVYPL